MAISLRLTPDAEKTLDQMVVDGKYKDRSDAMRAALNLLHNVIKEKKEGRIIVAIDRKTLEKNHVVFQLA